MFRSAFLSVLVVLILSNCSPQEPSLSNLRTNYEEVLLGTDAETILFSWQMPTDETVHGQTQKAYQIKVVDEENREVWNSGKVESGVSLAVEYKGDPLQPTTRYRWNVTVWDQDENTLQGASWFETGLNPDLSAWNGAQWIGGSDDDMNLQSHYLSVFKLEYSIQIEEGSERAAFVYGANDRRLMNKNLNLEKMEVEMDESYIAVELDISEIVNGGNAKLNVYRAGMTAEDDPSTPLHSLDISKALINSSNKNESHDIYLESVFGVTEIYVNGMEQKNYLTAGPPSSGPFGNSGINLNPYGRGGDYIVFPVLGDIGFMVDPMQEARFSIVTVRHYRKPSNVIFSENLENYNGIFQNSNLDIMDNTYRISGGDSGLKILADPSRNGVPMLRTEFEVEDKTIRKARIYATARGIYELHLNGQRVGDYYFTPGLTQYNKTHMYQTYDVTDLIDQGGKNALGAWLSEGWWSGNITFRGQNWNYFGDRQSLLAKMVVTYEDGTETVITSNPEEWKISTEGPIRYGSFFQGELYDATLESGIDGWSNSGYDDNDWKQVSSVSLEGTAVTEKMPASFGREWDLTYDDLVLIGQVGENVSAVKTMTAEAVEEVRPGVFVYDMGQNMVGVPKISISDASANDTLWMRYAEVRYPELEEYKGNEGMVMMENIRGALTQDLYITKSGPQVIEPRFTFHGFRFIEITGIEKALPTESVQVRVLSSVREIGSSYETSNSLLNRLWENITWSLRGNFVSIPTDTPARNERMGWNGDLNVFVKAATWLTQANQFLKRHLLAMRDMQFENGRFTDIAPVGNGFGGTLWGSAGFTVTWETYQQFGDKSILIEHYDAMKAYADFLETRLNDKGVLTEGPLGDWLSPENNKNDNTLLWTAYYIYDLQILIKVAEILGKENDAIAYTNKREEVKKTFNEVFIDKETGRTIKSGSEVMSFGPAPSPDDEGKPMDTQASYAIPLAMDAVNEEYKDEFVENLVATIKRKNVDDGGGERPEYSLMTGFIGTASMGEALSENGQDETIYKLVQSETYPSWLYPVKNGATTIWERLNSYTIEDGFGGNNSMNSFNHYAFGAIASWMYNYSLGIQRNPEDPGFKTFILKPTPDPTGQMTFAKGHYDSMYGKIVSEWYLEEGTTRYVITIPANTSATLYLKGSDNENVMESGMALSQAEGVTVTEPMGDRLGFQLVSGKYEFVVTQ